MHGGTPHSDGYKHGRPLQKCHVDDRLLLSVTIRSSIESSTMFRQSPSTRPRNVSSPMTCYSRNPFELYAPVTFDFIESSNFEVLDFSRQRVPPAPPSSPRLPPVTPRVTGLSLDPPLSLPQRPAQSVRMPENDPIEKDLVFRISIPPTCTQSCSCCQFDPWDDKDSDATQVDTWSPGHSTHSTTDTLNGTDSNSDDDNDAAVCNDYILPSFSYKPPKSLHRNKKLDHLHFPETQPIIPLRKSLPLVKFPSRHDRANSVPVNTTATSYAATNTVFTPSTPIRPHRSDSLQNPKALRQLTIKPRVAPAPLRSACPAGARDPTLTAENSPISYSFMDLDSDNDDDDEEGGGRGAHKMSGNNNNNKALDSIALFQRYSDSGRKRSAPGEYEKKGRSASGASGRWRRSLSSAGKGIRDAILCWGR